MSCFPAIKHNLMFCCVVACRWHCIAAFINLRDFVDSTTFLASKIVRNTTRIIYWESNCHSIPVTLTHCWKSSLITELLVQVEWKCRIDPPSLEGCTAASSVHFSGCFARLSSNATHPSSLHFSVYSSPVRFPEQTNHVRPPRPPSR